MSGVMDVLQSILETAVEIAILMFEYIGVGVIAVSGVKGLINFLHKKPETRLILAEGLAMGLEFKLGSEILRTVIVRSIQEIAIVGGIIVLRGTLTILLHWEIKNEKDKHAEKKENSKAE